LTLYLDTSVLIAAFPPEAESERVLDWLDIQEADLVVSDWVVTEFSAALSIKLRTRQIETTDRMAALAAFSRFCSNSAIVLVVSREQFRVAARFADQYAPGLRAGDALHLAISAEHGAMLCTLDRRLSSAGPALGVQTTLV
jgi:predicted nucleic acid-binding protein